MSTRTIKVDYLARVEGEGSLYLKIHDGRVEEARLSIFEPPRYFEALLQGRGFMETPDIVARICGICPVAYQMSAVHAIEHAFGVTVGGSLRSLRRLLYCGEWIESHSLHIYMLHAPDFLGYAGAVEMARDHREVVERGLQLKKAGNAIIHLLGGREIHPINVRPGGFYKIPAQAEIAALNEPLLKARDIALQTVRWVAGFDFPEFERDYEFVALRSADEYPMNEGRIVSSGGLDIAVDDYDAHFSESQVPHSTALHSQIKDPRGSRTGGHYLVGPLARFNLNFDRLSPLARGAAQEAGLTAPCRNPFKSIIARAVEVLNACEEALQLIAHYEPPPAPFVEATARAATGYGCTEAPRGLLYHRYELAADGTILSAKIVPPTSQNQGMIENDLRDIATTGIDWPEPQLKSRCEQMIRNYDPCISCATHFLKLQVERT
jgi:coenzyme F420-reducing hydrogenase alpha subunit